MVCILFDLFMSELGISHFQGQLERSIKLRPKLVLNRTKTLFETQPKPHMNMMFVPCLSVSESPHLELGYEIRSIKHQNKILI